MKSYRYIFSLFVIIFNLSLCGQGQENRFWYFGNGCGVDFGPNLNNPVVIPSISNSSAEGVASISDPLGNFLFYTNGVEIINSGSVQVSGNLNGHLSSSQSGVILPKPCSCDEYSVFTVDWRNNSGNGQDLQQVPVSTLGSGGLSVGAPINLQDGCREKVTATSHSNMVDYWIMSPIVDTKSMALYRLGCDTIVEAVLGGQNVVGLPDPFPNDNGYMKVSPSGDLVALAFSTNHTLILLNFNPNSGGFTFANSYNFNSNDFPYGVEFAPNNQSLFVSTWGSATGGSVAPGKIYEFPTLSLVPIDSLLVPPTTLSAGNYELGALQNGPDGLLYVTVLGENSLGAFNPNAPNPLGSFNPVQIQFAGTGAQVDLGLPNLVNRLNECNGELPCKDFLGNDHSLGDWNSHLVSSSIQTPGPSGNPQDEFIFGDDEPGFSGLFSAPTLTPQNWTNFLGECLCFDFRGFDLGGRAQTAQPTIGISTDFMSGGQFSLVPGVNPELFAEFTVSDPYVLGDDWVRYCAPIERCLGGSLPSNGTGSWEWAGGVANNCNDWDSLLSNVSHIVLRFDYTNNTDEQIGYDNICIEACPEQGCCDGETFIGNEDFESGNTGFQSAYSFQSQVSQGSVLPGEYSIVDVNQAATICSNWDVDDLTSFCDQMGSFMVVNGHTGRPVGSSSAIWSASFSNLTPGLEYQLCLNAKNLTQCCFDSPPELGFSDAAGTAPGNWTVVNAFSGPCQWEEISFNFTANSPTQTISLFLDESPQGDGNDIALDDITLSELPPVNSSFSTAFSSGSSTVISSYLASGTQDDFLPDGCEYLWFAAEVSDPANPLTSVIPGTLVTGGTNPSAGSIWPLTTTFPGFNGGFPDGSFPVGGTYIVGLWISNCDCFSGASSTVMIEVVSSTRQGKEVVVVKRKLKVDSKKVMQFLKEQQSSTSKPIGKIPLKQSGSFWLEDRKE